jgi:uncharacterized membrane protein YcfT
MDTAQAAQAAQATQAAPPVAQAAPPVARERVAWADAAKGACILLVVLWHVVIKHYLRIDWRTTVPIPGAWGTLGEQLLPLRMPLFFTISGMFAVGAVSRPWRVLGRSKVARFLYLYVLWLLIHTAVLAVTPDFDTAHADNLVELLAQLTIDPSNLWYLSALALYFTIAKAVRRLPAALVLAASFALSVVATADLLPLHGNQRSLLANLAFFLAGARFRPAIERLAATATVRRLALTGSAYAATLAAMAVAGAQTFPGVWPLVSVVATVAGVTAAAVACRWGALGTVLAGLGRQTLPIYVLHMPVLALLHGLLVTPLSHVDDRWQWMVAVIEPVAITAFVAWLCLLLHAGLRKARMRWLFDLPG